jgi:hypothetical protein
MERRQGLRVPSADTLTNRGKGTGAVPTHEGVAWPQADARVQGRAMVAPATTTTVAAVSWADDRVQQGQDQVGKFSSRHLTVRLFLL